MGFSSSGLESKAKALYQRKLSLDDSGKRLGQTSRAGQLIEGAGGEPTISAMAVGFSLFLQGFEWF